MKNTDTIVRVCVGASLLGLVATIALAPTPARSSGSSSVAAQVKAIDTDCSAIQDAVMALKPIQLIGSSSTWKVASDADVTVAERTKASVTIADVWKQGKNIAWVHSHSITQSGKQLATQLCFRQKDGTLERARQAATVPNLNEAGAERAYYASDGTLLQKSELFEANDPAVAKKITALPFYNQLP
jgi:hypothetical protein